MKEAKILAWVAWVAVCIAWGMTFPAIHIMVQSLPPMLAAGLRQGLAGGIFLLACLVLRLEFPGWRDWLALQQSVAPPTPTPGAATPPKPPRAEELEARPLFLVPDDKKASKP